MGKALDAEERLHVCFKIITSMMSAKHFKCDLFHYRNHGAAEGRVLVGLEAEDAQQNPDGLIETLESITYPYVEITNNLGYQRFLK